MADAGTTAPSWALGSRLLEINRGRQTGKLETEEAGPGGVLYFVAGELYLAPDHPACKAAAAWLEESKSVASKAADGADTNGASVVLTAPPFRQLAGPIVKLLGTSSGQPPRFLSGAGKIPVDLIGPLPTLQVIMELAVHGLDEQSLLRRLGGDKALLQARSGLEAAAAEVELQPDEGFVLSRLEAPASVRELLNQLDLRRTEALRALCRLQAVGLVESAEVATHRRGVEGSDQQLVGRLESRIGESLAEKPLEIETEQHRELLRSLLSRMGEITFFELLAVTPLSTDSEVHTAFFELGRLVHPSHTKRLGLEGKEGAFRLLFERATEAYLTLSDSERKLAYLREVGPTGQQAAEGQGNEKRDQEKQEVARTAYERALTLIERQDFYAAIQLLEQAVRVNPQAEYLTLLADCQAENPQWLDRAVFNYQKALRARPMDPSIQTRLGHVHERRGDYLAARSAYEAALEIAPEMQSAQAGLLRLGGNPDQDHKAGGLAERLRRFFGVGRDSD